MSGSKLLCRVPNIPCVFHLLVLSLIIAVEKILELNVRSCVARNEVVKIINESK